MSLNWDMTKVKTRELVEKHVIESMIWLSMPCGWGWELTEKNVAKAWDRISYFQKTVGSLMKDENGNDVPLTRDQVYSMIGLHTNVTPITDAAFLKNLYLTHCERNARIERELTKAL